MRIKKGDTITVITGKEKGKKGKVMKTFPTESRVLVEGLNMLKVFTRPSQQNPKGGISQVEGKLHVSNVQIICPRCSKPARISYQHLADGTKQRACKKCSEII